MDIPPPQNKFYISIIVKFKSTMCEQAKIKNLQVWTGMTCQSLGGFINVVGALNNLLLSFLDQDDMGQVRS